MLKVEQVMTRPVEACSGRDRVSRAVEVMRDRDCGCVPVVERAGGSGTRLVGIVTDRDVCMAMYERGRPLDAMLVRDVMTRDVCSCRADDSLGTVLRIMEANRLHRVPVVDSADRLVGMISWADLAREAARERGTAHRELGEARLARLFAAVSERRDERSLAAYGVGALPGDAPHRATGAAP